MSIELKICGLTTISDMRAAESIGADYVGMVVEVPYSRRPISRWQAQAMCQAARARPVLVVAQQPLDQLVEIGRMCSPFALQVHGSTGLTGTGDESTEQISELVKRVPDDTEIWRGLAVAPSSEQQPRPVEDSLALIRELAEAGVTRIVLDTRIKGEMGGTGVTCDWPTAAAIIIDTALPVMLAGGLGPDNVVEAIKATGATGVDMATGVERTAGRKDPAKLRALAVALHKLYTD